MLASRALRGSSRTLCRAFNSNSSISTPHFESFKDLTKEDMYHLLDIAADLKKKMKAKEVYRPLEGMSIGMIFQKRSTRTRVSTETGMAYLGAHPLFLGPSDIQLGVNETVKDSAHVLSRFNDILLARVYGHDVIEELNTYSSVPIINGLSEMHHPLQILADFLTLQETEGRRELEGKTFCYVGDGNNMLHSYMEGCTKLGMHCRAACPEGYMPDETITGYCRDEASKMGSDLYLTHDPVDAVTGSDFVCTDTWISMGQEEESARRLKDFAGYQVTMELCKHANPDWKFLHCLPRHPEEVDDEVFYSDRSLIWDEAENRMYTVMAVALALLGKA